MNEAAATESMLLSGWGRYPSQVCRVLQADSILQLQQWVASSKTPIIARGGGQAYGDASLQSSGVVSMKSLNYFHDFDPIKKTMTVAAGATLYAVRTVAYRYGLDLLILPGTQYATIAGAIAFNVHGKNHYSVGDFSHSVLALSVLVASGEIIECSRSNNAALFWATMGGMGLTGIIVTVTLQLVAMTHSDLMITTIATTSVTEILQCFKAHHESAKWMVAWLDHFQKPNAQGLGLFEVANPIEAEPSCIKQDAISKLQICIPAWWPAGLMNNALLRLYNKSRYSLGKRQFTAHPVARTQFYFPLNKLQQWNNLYGRNGFLQFQCVLPFGQQLHEHINYFLLEAQRRHCYSYLVVLKQHQAGDGALPFSLPGISLAMDFKNTTNARSLVQHFYDKVATWGGRIYLAKDAVMTKDQFKQFYQHPLASWQTQLARIDADAKFQSAMSQRLGIKE